MGGKNVEVRQYTATSATKTGVTHRALRVLALEASIVAELFAKCGDKRLPLLVGCCRPGKLAAHDIREQASFPFSLQPLLDQSYTCCGFGNVTQKFLPSFSRATTKRFAGYISTGFPP